MEGGGKPWIMGGDKRRIIGGDKPRPYENGGESI